MSDPEPVAGIDENPSPVATPEDEAAVVQGLDTAEKHPDNGSEFEEPELSAPVGEAEETVSEEELEQVVAGVDPDAVDLVGHDESDLVIESNSGVTVPEELGELPEFDDIVTA